jgi:hypothetical protein
MDDAMKELGRRAIAAGFAWVPGMRTTSGQRVVVVKPDENPIACYEDNGYSVRLAGGQVPDLADPATLGCLLAQVRERWGGIGSGVVAIIPHRLRWAMMTCGQMDDAISGDSEAAALVVALEAAPESAG